MELEFLYEPDVDWPDNDDGYSEPFRITLEQLPEYLDANGATTIPPRYIHYRVAGTGPWNIADELTMHFFQFMASQQRILSRTKNALDVEKKIAGVYRRSVYVEEADENEV